MRLAVLLMSLVLVALSVGPTRAVQPDEVLSDPGLESRARNLSRELRCMVCQNQSIDDSDAPLAKDLRVLVRERLKAGDADGQVLQFLTSRYGEFVLLRPKFGWRTALLWAAPALILIGGAFALLVIVRRRSGGGTTPLESVPLSDQEKRRLADLLDARDE